VLTNILLLALLGPGARPPSEAQATEATETTRANQATRSHLDSLESELAALDREVSAARSRSGEPLDTGLAERARKLHDEAIYLKVKSEKHEGSGGEGTGIDYDEVSSLREAVAKLRDDIRLSVSARPTVPPSETDASAPTRPQKPIEPREPAETRAQNEPDARDLEELPADTIFSARLLDTLSSENAEVGDRFEAVTVLPVTIRGKVVIPEGAAVFGAVESVDRAGRTDRKARLVLAFDRLDIAGKSQVITATVVGASRDLETGIGKEKKKLGIGAGVGGVLGAVLGGGGGAIAGAILGGTGAILGTQGKNVELPRGTMLQLRLDRPIQLRPRGQEPQE
jgi:hypothetical protein